MIRRLAGKHWLWYGLAVVVALLMPFFLSDFNTILLSQVWIVAIAALGLDLIMGYTGLASFAHGALFGLGAYTVAIAAVKHGITGFLPGLGIGLMVVLLASAALGLIALRGVGATFIIITLALGQMIWGAAQQWSSLTGGDNGLAGFARPMLGPLNLANILTFYYFSLAACVLTFVLLYLLVRSPFGITLIGVREQPRRMLALGYNVWLHRYVAFLISGLFAGLSGVLFAYYNLFVSPGHVNLSTTIQFIVMVIVGGKASLVGPVIGSIIIVFVSNTLSAIAERWQILLGALYVVIVIFATGGVVGLVKRLAVRPNKSR